MTLPMIASSALAAPMSSAPASDLIFHSGVPASQRSLLRGDLAYLQQLPLREASEFINLTGLPAAGGDAGRTWILERARFVVGKDFRWDGPSLLNLSAAAHPAASSGASEISAESTIGMTNIGALIYLAGRKINRLLGVRFDDHVIEITSPRVGLIQIGDGLFSETTLKRVGAATSPTARLLRLSTLIHESRHGDGNGVAAGFLHSKCPEGHRYAGRLACDAATNGPYAVEASFLFATASSCADDQCAPDKKEVMRAYALDYASRVQTKSEAETAAGLIAQINMTERQLRLALKFKTSGLNQEAAAREARSLQARLAELRQKVNMRSLSKPAWPVASESVRR